MQPSSSTSFPNLGVHMSQMPILTSGELLAEQGLVEDPREAGDTRDWAEIWIVDTQDPAELSSAGDYWNSGYAAFLGTGDVGRLHQYEGDTIGGFPLMIDPDLVEQFAAANPGFDP